MILTIGRQKCVKQLHEHKRSLQNAITNTDITRQHSVKWNSIRQAVMLIQRDKSDAHT